MKLETINGYQMYLRDEKDLWGYYQNGAYEPEETKLVQSILKPEWTCIDIGANIGYFTILMAKQCKYVVAFEPEPSNWDMLEKNRELNNIENVFLYRQAVSNKTGESTLYLCDKSHGMHRLYKSKHCTFRTTKVNIVRIDDLIAKIKVDFIKLDVEGAELGALKGMKNLLKRDHPIVLMEFHTPSIEEYGATPKQIYDFMTELGYIINLVPFTEHSTSIPLDELIAETNNISGGQNILCV